MRLPQLSLRDLFWLILVAAILCGWWVDRRQLTVTPVKSVFATRERLVFEIQIPHALNLFNATEGRMPKTHEEFMEKIIKANQIPLPELPPDNRYIWDPQTNELMVERPKAAALPQ